MAEASGLAMSGRAKSVAKPSFEPDDRLLLLVSVTIVVLIGVSRALGVAADLDDTSQAIMYIVAAVAVTHFLYPVLRHWKFYISLWAAQVITIVMSHQLPLNGQHCHFGNQFAVMLFVLAFALTLDEPLRALGLLVAFGTHIIADHFVPCTGIRITGKIVVMIIATYGTWTRLRRVLCSSDPGHQVMRASKRIEDTTSSADVILRSRFPLRFCAQVVRNSGGDFRIVCKRGVENGLNRLVGVNMINRDLRQVICNKECQRVCESLHRVSTGGTSGIANATILNSLSGERFHSEIIFLPTSNPTCFLTGLRVVGTENPQCSTRLLTPKKADTESSDGEDTNLDTGTPSEDFQTDSSDTEEHAETKASDGAVGGHTCTNCSADKREVVAKGCHVSKGTSNAAGNSRVLLQEHMGIRGEAGMAVLQEWFGGDEIFGAFNELALGAHDVELKHIAV